MIKKVTYEPGSRAEPTKADMLQYLTCYLCKGVYRDAHTINECMCTYCKGCIYRFFTEVPNRNKCPSCACELGGKPLETIVKDITLQNIVDWLIPDFKERDDKLKSKLLQEANERRVKKGKLPAEILNKPSKSVEVELPNSQEDQPAKTKADINFEFKLVPFPDEDRYLRMGELPKKLKYANKQKTVLTVKKHIHNYLDEPIDNIEVLCKNFPVADSHTLEWVKRTKWQNNTRVLILMYKRKKRIVNCFDDDQEMTDV